MKRCKGLGSFNILRRSVRRVPTISMITILTSEDAEIIIHVAEANTIALVQGSSDRDHHTDTMINQDTIGQMVEECISRAGDTQTSSILRVE